MAHAGRLIAALGLAALLVNAVPLASQTSETEAQRSEELAAAAALAVEEGQRESGKLHEAVRLYDAALAANPDNHAARIALGDLFLSRYNGDDARKSYEDVLKRSPDHPEALLGLARVERFDGGNGHELLEKVLELSPDLVPARLLLARHYLDLEDFDAANREAQRALDLDAKVVGAHALLAAAALVAGDKNLFRELLQEGLDAKPGDPEIFVILAEVAARNRLYQRAVDFAGRAVDLDKTSWRGWALRGVNRLRIGAMEEGRQDLETAFSGDPFDVWTKNTLDLLDSMDSYKTIRTDRFELVLPADEADLLSLYLGPLAEEAYDALAAHYGSAPPTPIRLEFFPRHADFSVRTVGLVGLGALGVCFGPVIAMDSPTARPAGEFHWGTTLWHEIAHTFHMHLSKSRVPRWFTEGLSVFEERRARPGWGDRIHPEYLIAYHQERLAPIEDLNQGFMRPQFPGQVPLSYLQSSLVFDHIVERWGWPVIVEMLRAYGEGRNTSDIFDEVLGTTLEKFADGYDEAFQKRFSGPLASVQTNEDKFFVQWRKGAELLTSDTEAAVAHLERAHELFPGYAGADSPAWLLAKADLEAGRQASAEARLAALTQINKSHYPALLQLAETRAELGDLSGAARALEDAQFVYPYQLEDHQKLAEWFQEDVHRVVRARRAIVALKPFNTAEALYQLARALHAAGDHAAARRKVLSALESAPNYEDALAFLLELRGE